MNTLTMTMCLKLERLPPHFTLSAWIMNGEVSRGVRCIINVVTMLDTDGYWAAADCRAAAQ